MSRISQRILQLIKEKDISYSELSKRTGISKSALQRYAVGDTPKIPIERVEAIATALGVNAQELLFDGVAYFPEQFIDQVSKSLFAGASAIPEEHLRSINFHEQIDKPVEDMTADEIANLPKEFSKALEDFHNTIKPSFEKLNTAGRAEAVKRVEELAQIPKYTTPDDPDKEET